MQRSNDTPSGLKFSVTEGIEVRLWDIYLTRSRKSLNQFLSSYSLDNGPYMEAQAEHARVVFRFTLFDWHRTLMASLQEHHIPYEIVRTFLLQSNGSKKKVYVAEDDLDILFALNTILEEAGYDVLLSHCGERMLEPNLPPTDLFILDRRIPRVDGIEICKHLKKQVYTRNIPVIMISAGKNAAQAAFDAGANDFLEKPFPMKTLLKLVDKHTSNITGQHVAAHI